MNKKMAEKIWLMINKVRKNIEISQLCKLLIYSFVLELIRIKKDEYEVKYLIEFDEKYTVNYLTLTYGKVIKPYDLGRYIAEFEREIGFEDTIIANEFERLLINVDEEVIRAIWGEIAMINFESLEQLYEVTLILLHKMSRAIGTMRAENFTSTSVCKLEAKLLDCKEGMLVYDGFCGSGVSINEVAGNKGIVYMQDINTSALALAKIVTLLKGNNIGEIRCSDSILNPVNDMLYDRIVCEPPFGLKYTNDYLMSIPENNCIHQDILNSESVAIRHVLARLKDDGVAVIVVPMGMLFKSGRMATVREILAKNYIDAVIELPSGAWMNTGIVTALVILKKNKKDDSIYMLNAKGFFKKEDKIQFILSDEKAEEITKMYKNREIVEGVSNNVNIMEIESKEYNLCTAQYVTLNLEDTIVIEDNMKFVKKYNQLESQLADVEKQIFEVRSRFTKEV